MKLNGFALVLLGYAFGSFLRYMGFEMYSREWWAWVLISGLLLGGLVVWTETRKKT